jgi:transposase
MGEVTTVGLDLAKLVFQVHGADAAGRVVFRKTLRRAKVLEFFGRLSPCGVAMEACAGAHHWGREIARLGHTVRLIPPAYVKPFVKRQKNDLADAEAICEAAQRPTMRFVAVKSAEAQASAAIFRTRDLLVRQRTQHINAIRGQLTEYGLVVGKGPAHLPKLVALAEAEGCGLPTTAQAMLEVLVDIVNLLDQRIARLDQEIRRRAREEDVSSRLMTIPGIGPITATALAALAPPPETFRKRARLRGMGRPHAASEIDRRQAEVGRHLPDGRAHPATAAHCRCQRCRASRKPARPGRGLVAGADARAQAAHAGDRGARQQDGTHRLGVAGQE